MRWAWDRKKDRANSRKHGIGFETARAVFNDPLAVSRPDPYEGEERWQTIGSIMGVLVVVVHTWPDPDDETGGSAVRIISARKATSHERRAYEEGRL